MRKSTPVENGQVFLETLTTTLESAASAWEQKLETRSRLDLSVGQSGTALDLVDDGDAFVVTIDVPGYDPEDLEIQLTGKRLQIRGDRDRAVERDDDHYLRREREITSFARRLRLPEPIDADAVGTTLTNGVLTIRLPPLEVETDAHEIE